MRRLELALPTLSAEKKTKNEKEKCLRSCLHAGAPGVCRAAISETVLPVVLQRFQGPGHHHMWGESPAFALLSFMMSVILMY